MAPTQTPASRALKPSLGLIGLGAFGQFMAGHLAPHFDIVAHDAVDRSGFAQRHGMALGTLAKAAACDIVVLAVPVDKIEETAAAIAPLLKKGALVLDVASVKLKPAQALLQRLPGYVDIVCTHPLFGPQSACNGLAGHKIVVCPVRGNRTACVAAFLADLGLDVIETTPDAHDRDLATVQGLTHMIAKILVQMEPLPRHMTTRSFDLIMGAVEMVRYDSEELFLAIERENPYSPEVRREFFSLAEKLRTRLADEE